jgi:hypothetical protein
VVESRVDELVRERSWWQRVVARLRDDYQEDGVFRPVRLSFWTELMVSAAIIVFVLAAFAGFILFLARTQH